MTTNTDTTAASGAASHPEALPTRGQIRDVFLRHGFTVKEGQTDLKPYVYDAAYALLALAAPAAQEAEPTTIDMVLHCPACGLQHIDAPDERTPGWKNEPHRSHLCHGCDHIWRPADVPTNGVAAVQTKGKADSPIAARAPRPQADAGAPDPWREHLAEQADRIDCKALKRAMAKYGCSTPEGGMDHFRASLGTMVNLFVQAAAEAADSVLAARAAAPQAPAAPTAAAAEQVSADEEAVLDKMVAKAWDRFEAEMERLQAPAAGAAPTDADLPDVEDMAHSALQDALSFGLGHDVLHRWMRAVMDKTVKALAAAPAQEADAARYRWLRDKTEWEPFDSAWLCKMDIYGCPSRVMDAVIDAARARQEGQA